MQLLKLYKHSQQIGACSYISRESWNLSTHHPQANCGEIVLIYTLYAIEPYTISIN